MAATVGPGAADRSPVVSDFGSETGAASRAHVWPGAVSLAALSALISAYDPHQVCYSHVRVVRDEEAAGSNRPPRLRHYGCANRSWRARMTITMPRARPVRQTVT
jgi:hypothetical protein